MNWANSSGVRLSTTTRFSPAATRPCNSSASIQGVKDGYITAVLDQQPYLQGFYGVLSAVLQKKYGLTSDAIAAAARRALRA